LNPAEFDGFTVDEAEIIWWGYCELCAGSARSAPTTS
jgi:hypothetical protein